jgi:Protein of unknown function (DUF3750)
MSDTSLPPEAQPAQTSGAASQFVRVGILGGWIGGTIAGGLGAVVGQAIKDIQPPPLSALTHAALPAVAWGLAGGAAGALVALVVGPRRGRRAAFSWPLVAAFWSALVASVEVAHVNVASGAWLFLLGMIVLPALLAAGRWMAHGLWKVRWLLLGWLLLCLVGEVYSRLRPRSFTPISATPGEPVVQMGYSPLPTVLGLIAVHYHFLTFDPAEGKWHRWDLWQYANEGGTSWGHVHRDLLQLDSGVGGGPPRIEREWHGGEAIAIQAALARSGEYPDRDKYLAWPGPNSNTYPAWVLRQAGVSADMDPRAIGRDYHGCAGIGRTTTATGVQAESSLLGVKLGLEEGVELHFLGFTLGSDFWPPALKTPLGRFGFAE